MESLRPFEPSKTLGKHSAAFLTFLCACPLSRSILTKRTAEELTDYLREIGINVRYLHSEIDALERVEILRALRMGEFDVLVGLSLIHI